MKKVSLLVLTACFLMTACAGHESCYEESECTHCEKAVKAECGCHKASCGCQNKSCKCGAAAAQMGPQIFPMMPQPKTIVVVVPATKPQRRVFTPEIVYPEPVPCGCKR